MDCWSCGAERGDASFCTSCQLIQPLPQNADFFKLLSLPKKMSLDRAALESAFRGLSLKVHPDRFPRASPVERRLALEHTTQLNDAYRTLKAPQTRAEYLMKLEGVEVGSEEARLKDPAFLMEMMELQEEVSEASDEDALEKMERDIKARHTGLMKQLHIYFDEGQGARDDALKALDQLRFVGRLLERIEVRLEEMS